MCELEEMSAGPPVRSGGIRDCGLISSLGISNVLIRPNLRFTTAGGTLLHFRTRFNYIKCLAKEYILDPAPAPRPFTSGGSRQPFVNGKDYSTVERLKKTFLKCIYLDKKSEVQAAERPLLRKPKQK